MVDNGEGTGEETSMNNGERLGRDDEHPVEEKTCETKTSGDEETRLVEMSLSIIQLCLRMGYQRLLSLSWLPACQILSRRFENGRGALSSGSAPPGLLSPWPLRRLG